MSSLALFDAEIPDRPAGRRRGQARVYASVDDGLFTEIVDFEALSAFRAAWADLAARALEPNAFLEPGFALPLFQHCGTKTKVQFLLAWAVSGTDQRHRLLGLLPLSKPNVSSLIARGASHDYAPLGTPLFDRDRGQEALGQMIGWLRLHRPVLKGLMLSQLPTEGPTAALLRRHAEAAQTRQYLFNEYERAALAKAAAGPDGAMAFLSAKRRKQYRQQRRRLNETGKVAYRTISDPAQIAQAAEDFLALEAKGWKGARKTALQAARSDAAFFRDMTRLMAFEGKCRIDTLDMNGTPVAMGVVLQSGDRAYYWKTAYDERFAALSPGVQLTLDLTQTQLSAPSVALTDSCAIANHPMIDHIWKDRIAMGDVLLPLGPAQGLFFKLGLWQEIVQHHLRHTLKPIVKRLLRRR